MWKQIGGGQAFHGDLCYRHQLGGAFVYHSVWPTAYISPFSQSCWQSWHICPFAKDEMLRKPTIAFILIKNLIVHPMLTVTEPFCCLSPHMHLLQGTAFCSFLHSAWQLVLQTKRLIEHFLKLSTALMAGAERTTRWFSVCWSLPLSFTLSRAWTPALRAAVQLPHIKH